MTDHHDPSHGHDHGRSHSHDHGHLHSYVHHTHDLSFEEKLEKLCSHWIDHNDSHKDTFFTWAKRAEDAGLKEAASRIEKAGQLSREITRQLKAAKTKLME